MVSDDTEPTAVISNEYDATLEMKKSIAVAPSGGTPAQVNVATNNSKRNAESVLRSLSDMGLPLDRVRLSAVTSGDAGANEVHLYVR